MLLGSILVFLERVTVCHQSYGRTPKPGSVPESGVSDPEGQFPMKLEKQQRCAVCHARVRWMCKKCLKTLCMERDCFERFHTGKIMM